MEKEEEGGTRCRDAASSDKTFFAAHVAFSFGLWLVRRRGIQPYARTSVTVFTALTIRLFKVKIISVAFLHVSQRAFLPKRFLC